MAGRAAICDRRVAPRRQADGDAAVDVDVAAVTDAVTDAAVVVVARRPALR